MELVYLWVEEYKNIYRQGFNFSPRFECEYKDGNLTICDKKKKECKDNEYLENFFGKNINVTAIVGKNGTGKSNVLEVIKYGIIDENKNKTYFVLMYDRVNNIFILQGNIEDSKRNRIKESLEKADKKYNLSSKEIHNI